MLAIVITSIALLLRLPILLSASQFCIQYPRELASPHQEASLRTCCPATAFFRLEDNDLEQSPIFNRLNDASPGLDIPKVTQK